MKTKKITRFAAAVLAFIELSAGTALAGQIWTDFAAQTDSLAGLQPAGGTPKAPAVTLTYDLAGQGLDGPATKLQVKIKSVSGANLFSPLKLGLSVESGNASWWEIGEDLTFTLSLRDAANKDVTAQYRVDLIGAEVRLGPGGKVTFNGQTVGSNGKAGEYVKFVLNAGETSETEVKAARGEAAIGQLGALQFNIEPI